MQDPRAIMAMCMHTSKYSGTPRAKVDTIGTKDFVCCSEVSLAQGLVVDHTPPTIAASNDKALLWMTKDCIDERSVN